MLYIWSWRSSFALSQPIAIPSTVGPIAREFTLECIELAFRRIKTILLTVSAAVCSMHGVAQAPLHDSTWQDQRCQRMTYSNLDCPGDCPACSPGYSGSFPQAFDYMPSPIDHGLVPFIGFQHSENLAFLFVLY